MKIDNENNISMKQSWNTCFNLINVIKIDALELTLLNDESQGLISLAHLKLFKKCPWPLNSELEINRLYIWLSN